MSRLREYGRNFFESLGYEPKKNRADIEASAIPSLDKEIQNLEERKNKLKIDSLSQEIRQAKDKRMEESIRLIGSLKERRKNKEQNLDFQIQELEGILSNRKKELNLLLSEANKSLKDLESGGKVAGNTEAMNQKQKEIDKYITDINRIEQILSSQPETKAA